MALAGAGTEGFLRHLATEPEEKEHPGFFGNNLYAAMPVIFDGLGVAAQAFAAEYTRVIREPRRDGSGPARTTPLA